MAWTWCPNRPTARRRSDPPSGRNFGVTEAAIELGPGFFQAHAALAVGYLRVGTLREAENGFASVAFAGICLERLSRRHDRQVR